MHLFSNMDAPALYVGIGVIIQTAVGAIIYGIIQIRRQKHSQNREIGQDAYNGLLLLIDQLKQDIDHRKDEYNQLSIKVSVMNDRINHCEEEHSRERHRREYLESIMIEKGIKIPGWKPKGLFKEEDNK